MHRVSRSAPGAVVLSLTILIITSSSLAVANTKLSPARQRAMLEYTVSVEGGASHSGTVGEHQKWKAKRHFEGRVEVEAQPPERHSIAMSFGQAGTAGGQPPPSMDAYQKQIEACGDNFQCQMAVSMKLVNSPEMQAQIQASERAAAQPPRYQVWRVVPGGRKEIKASLEEDTDNLFFTAEREHTLCSYRGNYGTGDFKDTLAATVEVDGVTGTSLFTGWPVVPVSVNKQCKLSFGPRRETSETFITSLMPRKLSQDLVSGGAGNPGKAITAGSTNVTGILEDLSRNNAPTSVRVSLQWRLVPL